MLYGISHGVDTVFLWAAPASVVVFLLAWAVREVPLRGGSDGSRPTDSPAGAEPELVQ